jgi:threonine aldolase
MDKIDLRSDTVTLPTEAMLRAMAIAPLGDDVSGDDPTVNLLQDVSAERLGKEAGLFVPSGTMGNLIGLLVNAASGTEVITEARSHIFLNEGAGAAVVGGIQLRQVETDWGVLTPDHVGAAVRPTNDAHQPRSAAIAIENTHNRQGGIAWTVEELDRLGEVARRHRLAVHIDGARIFNAALAVSADVKEIVRVGDTVSFCFSKGLSCPVGSMLCGSSEKIAEAKRWRKMLGGGMRQVGVLAAAGLVALETMVERLSDDHDNARLLAEGLAEISAIECELARVQTNIVYFRVQGMDLEKFVAECSALGLLGAGAGSDEVRFVTHAGIEAADVKRALKICDQVVNA